MTEAKQIIVVGDDLGAHAPNLIHDLLEHGFQVVKIRGTAELAAGWRGRAPIAVLTYDSRGRRSAEEAIRAVAKTGAKIPVVALVEHGSFDDYYQLMCQGAHDYFEVRPNEALEPVLVSCERLR